jgi:hypothetical protein
VNSDEIVHEKYNTFRGRLEEDPESRLAELEKNSYLALSLEWQKEETGTTTIISDGELADLIKIMVVTQPHTTPHPPCWLMTGSLDGIIITL